MGGSQRERSLVRVLRMLAPGRQLSFGTASSSPHGPSRLTSPLNLHGLDGVAVLRRLQERRTVAARLLDLPACEHVDV